MSARRRDRAWQTESRPEVDCRSHRFCGNEASWYLEIENSPPRGSTRVFACTPCKERSDQVGWKPWPEGGLRG